MLNAPAFREKRHFADIGTRKPILLLKILKMYDSESFAEFLDNKYTACIIR